ncbi:MAG: PQQ-like beta-propeller repeat protein [Candidatus Omnitrophica bacterium]|nr:PQQ-like beta-propeller repeat protein [Candidatus Omnitrophota bacterium]
MNHSRPVVIAVLLFIPLDALAENWPNWRGPNSNGISNEKSVPIEWDRETNVIWRIDLPERGNSTPIVWDDKIFLTQAIEAENRRTLMCFNRNDGTLLWQSGVTHTKNEPTHRANPYCSASPVSDGERVIAWYGPAGVSAYDLEGNELWHTDLGDLDHMWGYGSSPILYKDLVIINFGPGNREFLVALNKKTGEEVWRVYPPHAPEYKGEDKAEKLHGAWNTPKVIERDGRDELAINWSHVTVAYNPLTGDEYWRCGGLGDLSYANPIWGEGVLVALGGYHGPGFAVRPKGDGDQTETNRLWTVDRSPLRLGAGIILDGHLYIPDMQGVLECKNLTTGDTVWEERLKGDGPTSETWSSLVLADGNLYLMNKSGTTFVVKAKPEFELVSVNPLGEHTNASTVISDGEIFIRTDKSLWCIGD